MNSQTNALDRWTGRDDIAKRAAGIVKDPDYMSQSVMRFEGFKKVPDPLLANVRALIAVTDSRYVMVPALISFCFPMAAYTFRRSARSA